MTQGREKAPGALEERIFRHDGDLAGSFLEGESYPAAKAPAAGVLDITIEIVEVCGTSRQRKCSKGYNEESRTWRLNDEKTVTLALLLAASLGLAACDKKEEDKAAAPAAPATETQPSAPATPLPSPAPRRRRATLRQPRRLRHRLRSNRNRTSNKFSLTYPERARASGLFSCPGFSLWAPRPRLPAGFRRLRSRCRPSPPARPNGIRGDTGPAPRRPSPA